MLFSPFTICVKGDFLVLPLPPKNNNTMWQIKTIFLVLFTSCLCACTKEKVMTGYRTTAETPWEVVDMADSTDSVFKVILGFGLGSFHVQQATQAQESNGVCVLLNMMNGSYSNVDGDFDMRYFSLGEDTNTLIPNMKELTQEIPGLTICALANEYPEWLSSKHIQEELFQEAFALYLSKFIDEYQKKGIGINTLIIPDSNQWGDHTESKITEIASTRNLKLNYINGIYSENENSLTRGTQLPQIWQALTNSMDMGLIHAGVVLQRTDTPNTYFWKKSLCKHLCPLIGHTFHYLKSEENKNILAFKRDDGKILYVICNAQNKAQHISLYDSCGQGTKIVLPPESLTSFLS